MKTEKVKNMDPKDIRIALFKADVSQAAIARALGVKAPSVSRVIDGLVTSNRIRRKIAEVINKPVEMIWPSTYLYKEPGGPGRPMSPDIDQPAA